ncbi:helix-turn-helix domain-containing protein [Enterococcus rotai]|uniref:helix-turn-helix domain-containing protein n=1 Tax=Enterococcus rotai TaxID=118060 RepID=UPI0035C6F3C3
MMKYNDSLKLIRQFKKKKINEMNIGKSRLAYSRIEKGETKINLNDLKIILENLEITPDKLIKFTGFDTEYELFKKLLNKCISNPDNQELKNELLRNYYNPKNIPRKNKKELYYLIGITANFRGLYNEIKDISSDEIIYIFQKLINQEFFTEYDYLISMNFITLLSEDMIDQLANKLYPISLKERRNENLIRYSSLMIINIASKSIYNLNYRKAIYYTNLLEENTTVQENYYLHLAPMSILRTKKVERIA